MKCVGISPRAASDSAEKRDNYQPLILTTFRYKILHVRDAEMGRVGSGEICVVIPYWFGWEETLAASAALFGPRHLCHTSPYVLQQYLSAAGGEKCHEWDLLLLALLWESSLLMMYVCTGSPTKTNHNHAATAQLGLPDVLDTCLFGHEDSALDCDK
jgi:hypothetical protein